MNKGRPLKILLVDDDERRHAMVQDFLFALGPSDAGSFSLEWAATYEIGLEQIQKNEYDVCLVDYMLGARCGVDLIREALAGGCETPMILLTGKGGYETDLEAMRAGAVDYLEATTLTPSILGRAIRYAIERARSVNALRESRDRLAILRRVDIELSRQLDVAYVLTRAADAAMRLSSAHAGFIGLIDDAGLRVADAIGPYPPDLRGSHLSLDSGITARVIRQGQAELVRDVAADPDYVALLPETRAQIVIPLIPQEQPIGILILETSNPARFTPDVFEYLELLAARISVAIANARMYEGERRYRKIIEEASDVFYTTDPQGYCTYASPSAELLTGYANDEFVGKHFTFLVAPEWRVRTQVFYQEQFKARVPETRYEFPIITQSGEEKWVEQTVMLIAEGDWIIGFQGIVRDVTDRKRAEMALHESEEKFRSIVEQLSDGLILFDELGMIVEWNRAQEVITGLKRDKVLGRSLWEVLFQILAEEQDKSKLFEQLKTGFAEMLTRRSGASPREFSMEYNIQRPDGTRRTVEFTIFLIETNEGIRIGGITQDITERKQAEEEREKLIAELDAFSHTVAHDLKNPLGVITTYAGLLQGHRDTLDEETQQRFLKSIGQGGHKMAAIIDALLLLARVRGTDDVPVERLDMASVVEEARQRLAHMIDEYQAEISLPATWPVVSGYTPWIEEIWANYLSNAIKYGGQPPSIELGAGPYADGMVRFWVSDNGPGLTPENLAQIFIPFTRLGMIEVEGHGLGLSIVQRIVEKLGGEVGVESAPGVGSIFSFTLPGVVE